MNTMDEIWDEAGEAAWNAYAAAVGGRAFNGDPLPTWQVMKEDPKRKHLTVAWIAAAKAAVETMQ